MKKLLGFVVVLLVTAAAFTMPWLLHGCAEEDNDVSSMTSSQMDANTLSQTLKMTVCDKEVFPSYISITDTQSEQVFAMHFDYPYITEVDCNFGDLEVTFSRLPYSATATVFFGEDTVFGGSLSDLYDLSVYESGAYTVLISAMYDDDTIQGTASYSFSVQAEAKPEVVISADTVHQGGYLVVSARNVTNPKITTSLSFEPNVFFEDGVYTSFIPISYKTKAGDYDVHFVCDEFSEEFEITVEKFDFDVQYMYIDQEVADNTVNSSNADWELYVAMKPVKALCDEVMYANGDFIWPVKGRITTEFGMIRYVNDSEDSSRHSGIDIAAPQGTEIVAPNAGRVILSQYLQMTGNTVVIEHGYGLKSIYYHMSELDCELGDMVEKGDLIGKVGSTGFSSGPHLHFSMAVNTVWIDPWLFIDESERIN